MIVIDARRQAHDLGPRNVFSALSVPGNPLPGGHSWSNARQYLFPRSSPSPVRLNCTVCYTPYMAVNAALAKVCGPTCRKRLQRARQKGGLA